MKNIVVELSNGYRYEVTGHRFAYRVYCISPEEKKGYIREIETNLYLGDGTKVYKSVANWSLQGAIHDMNEHAGLNVDHSASFNHYAECCG